MSERRIAYLFPAFPLFHQTFVLSEVLGLRRNSASPKIYSLPVVASAVPGVEELVSNGVTGYLVPPNRSEGFAPAVQELADRPDDRVRFGNAARRRVLQDLDNNKNIRELAALLTGTAADAVPLGRAVAAGWGR